MNVRLLAVVALAGGLGVAATAGAAPRLEIGPLTRTVALQGLRACYAVRPPGSSDPGLRFLTTGSTVYFQDSGGQLWPLLFHANLFGAVSDPDRGILLCTSRGVYATRDGRSLRRISSLVFTRVIA